MNRRRFLIQSGMAVGIGASTLWGVGCTTGSEANGPLIGIVQFATTANLDSVRSGVLKGLQLAGFQDGVNVRISVLNAGGDVAQVNAHLNSLVGQGAKVVVAIGSPVAKASNSIRTQIPIVFCGVVDPIAAEIAVSQTQGKPNATGVMFNYDTELGLKLVKEALPAVTKIGSLIDTSELFSAGLLSAAQAQSAPLGLTFLSGNISSPTDIVATVQNLKSQGVQAVLQLPSNTAGQGVSSIVSECKAQGLPLFALQTILVGQGVIAAVGPDPETTGVQAGGLVNQILKGVQADTLPIQKTQKSTLLVDKTAASAFGVTLPTSLLNRADKVLP